MRALLESLETRSGNSLQGAPLNHLGFSVDKLRMAQFRQGSLYTNLKAFVPVPVLVVIWLWVIHWRSISSYDLLLGQTVTVRHLLLACGIVGVWNLLFGLSLYRTRSAKEDVAAELARVTAVSFACSLLLLVGNITRGRSMQGVFLSGVTAAGLLAASIALLFAFFIGAVLSSRLLRTRSAIVVGSGSRAVSLVTQLRTSYSPFRVFGFVDDERLVGTLEKETYLGKIDDLEELLKVHPVEMVLIGLPMRSKYNEIQKVMNVCENVGVDTLYMRDIFETRRAHVRVKSQELQNFTVWSTQNSDPKRYLKRVFDVLGASALLILSSPLMLVAAIAVRCSSSGPIFFVQQRYGLHRKRFAMF